MYRLERRACLAVLCFFILASLAVHQVWATPLDDYVAKPDSNFTWKLNSTIKGEKMTGYVLDMTSQAWLTAAEVDRPVWKHWVVVIKPDTITSSKALLFIEGGSNNNGAPTKIDDMLAQFALTTNSVVIQLKMIPNQPLTFAGETKPRGEDALIAYTWRKYVDTGDARWPARLPMTKGAVRAMDATQAFLKTPEGGNVTIDGFVVAGGSKRGWTTWTTAAVDPRVMAIMPAVIDVLNVKKSMLHHHAAYGFWAPAVGNYVEMNIMEDATLNAPRFQELMDIVDPYSYRQRYTMPKYIVNSSGDQFFLPDSSQFYFADLPGEKYLRYVPNTDHGLKGSDAPQTMAAFYHAVLNNKPRPKFAWKKEQNGELRVTVQDTPTEVNLWQATNPKARDFRLESLGPVWTSSPLKPNRKGEYITEIKKPSAGWTAFFVELVYPSGCKFPFKFTTEVSVIPDKYPAVAGIGDAGKKAPAQAVAGIGDAGKK